MFAFSTQPPLPLLTFFSVNFFLCQLRLPLLVNFFLFLFLTSHASFPFSISFLLLFPFFHLTFPGVSPSPTPTVLPERWSAGTSSSPSSPLPTSDSPEKSSPGAISPAAVPLCFGVCSLDLAKMKRIPLKDHLPLAPHPKHAFPFYLLLAEDWGHTRESLPFLTSAPLLPIFLLFSLRQKMASPSLTPTPFTINVPDSDLDDLRRRLEQTRFPDQLEGVGWTYGTELTYLKELVDYWKTKYDWRKQEALLNRQDASLCITLSGRLSFNLFVSSFFALSVCIASSNSS